jgi:hypothetical protein
VCVCTCHQGASQHKIQLKGDTDAPTLGSYDGCCDDVGQQGQRQVAHLGDVDDEGEVFIDLRPLWSDEQASPHHDRNQVNDWGKVRIRTDGERKQAGVRPSSARMTTGVIKMTLFWSEQMTQARQTTTPSVMINLSKNVSDHGMVHCGKNLKVNSY